MYYRQTMSQGQTDTVRHLGTAITEMDRMIRNAVPECRERSLAITKLQECFLWLREAVGEHEELYR